MNVTGEGAHGFNSTDDQDDDNVHVSCIPVLTICSLVA